MVDYIVRHEVPKSNLRLALCQVASQMPGVEGIRSRLKIARFLRNWDQEVDVAAITNGKDSDYRITFGQALEDQLTVMLVAERVAPDNVLSPQDYRIDWLALIDFLKKILPIILDIIAFLLIVMRKQEPAN